MQSFMAVLLSEVADSLFPQVNKSGDLCLLCGTRPQSRTDGIGEKCLSMGPGKMPSVVWQRLNK